ncbi:MAG TPA: hypothetical protein ENI90_03270 [Methylothermaceae bacterium]|nr:hypothetical protein [Methylothermaceae bacterium]
MTETKERPFELFGKTVKIDAHLADGTVAVFLTINYKDGRPFEVFINTANPQLNEHMAVMTLLISRMLQGGFSLEVIAEDLFSVESAFTGHMAAGGFHPSLAARIGRELKNANLQPELDFTDTDL